jgi:hypothetical protein
MPTFSNVTATIELGTIEADTPQQAAQMAYEAVMAQLGLPNRISVWTQGVTPAGAVDYKASLWTFEQDPTQIVPPVLEPAVAAKPITEENVVPAYREDSDNFSDSDA